MDIEYLVVSTGYTIRLLHHDRLILLRDYCNDLGVIPLFLYDMNILYCLPCRDGSIAPDINHYEEDTCDTIIKLLSQRDLLDQGVLVFRVGTFDNASKVLCTIDSLDHCKIGPMRKFMMLPNSVMYAYFETSSPT